MKEAEHDTLGSRPELDLAALRRHVTCDCGNQHDIGPADALSLLDRIEELEKDRDFWKGASEASAAMLRTMGHTVILK